MELGNLERTTLETCLKEGLKGSSLDEGKSNEIISDVVVNIDLAPTIVEMGGGKMEAVDGVSFLPSILQDTPQFF